MSENEKKYLPADGSTEPNVEQSERGEVLPELDELARTTARTLYTLDRYIDSGEAMPDADNPIAVRYQRGVEFLQDADQEKLQQLVDPKGVFCSEQFSLFELSVQPPGMIHIELGTPDDLRKFRKILEGDSFQSIWKEAGLADTREADHFAAQYFSPAVFGGGEYLGVVVSIRSQIADEIQRKKALRHEYGHAVQETVLRPLFHRTVIDIDIHASATAIGEAIKSVEEERRRAIATHLDILPSPDLSPHMQALMMGKSLKDEQYLLDELRAFTFNFPPLTPKFQTTNLDLSDDDSFTGADIATVKKYFEVWLLHLRARLTSAEARSRSVAILGSALSLRQAQRLLESEASTWRLDQGENDAAFAGRIRALSVIMNSPEYMDFQHAQGGELVSKQHARQVLILDKTAVDAEVQKRWGGLDKAPETFLKDYDSIYR